MVTFQDKEKRFTCTVKEAFLSKCPNPSNYNSAQLFKDFDLLSHLHNTSGPALIKHDAWPITKKPMLDLINEGRYLETRKGPDRYEFWIDGRCINRENPNKAADMWDKFNGDTI